MAHCHRLERKASRMGKETEEKQKRSKEKIRANSVDEKQRHWVIHEGNTEKKREHIIRFQAKEK